MRVKERRELKCQIEMLRVVRLFWCHALSVSETSLISDPASRHQFRALPSVPGLAVSSEDALPPTPGALGQVSA